MATEIASKSELAALSSKFSSISTQLVSDMTSLMSVLSSVPNCDDINVAGAASILKSNLECIQTDLETISTNISNYVSNIEKLDVDDFASASEISQDIVRLLDNSNQTNSSNDRTWTAVNLSSTGTPSGGTTSFYSSNHSSNSSSSSGSWNPSYASLDSVVTSTMSVTPTGQTSSNGRTQRSALTEIVISPGDPDDPNIDISKYHNKLEQGFEVTTGNLTYKLCDEDIELLCAIVSAESDKTYDDALAVISTILNRCESSNWIRSHGRDPIAQATAPNQYVVYQHGSYERYMNGNAPATVVQAVKDALAGVRNHKYTSFRSNGTTSYSSNMISPTGNRYL